MKVFENFRPSYARSPRARASARLGGAVLLWAALGLTGFAQAQSPGDPGAEPPLFHDYPLSEDAERAIREFLDAVGPLLRRLESLVRDLPAYEAPEILPNGDILIRRKHRPEQPPEAPPAEPAPPGGEEPQIKT